MTRKRKNKSFGTMFHGMFSSLADAKKKKRKTKGAVVKRASGGRYLVMSERKNPIKRKKKAKPKTNPTELIVMGANPQPLEATGRSQQQEFTVPAGTTILIRTNPIGRNPSAATLREEFVGRPSESVSVGSEPHMPAGDYAQLGELLALYVKPFAGGHVQHINFKRGERPLLVSDETARQLWFAGGEQDITSALSAFGFESARAGIFELGEARRIDYKQRKEHVPDPDVDEWRHEFGEETGVRPVLAFDANHKRLLLKGGAYEVRPEGITN